MIWNPTVRKVRSALCNQEIRIAVRCPVCHQKNLKAELPSLLRVIPSVSEVVGATQYFSAIDQCVKLRYTEGNSTSKDLELNMPQVLTYTQSAAPSD